MEKTVSINPMGNYISIGGRVIRSFVDKIKLNESTIIYAINNGVRVTEILEDGTQIILNKDNYNKNNSKKKPVVSVKVQENIKINENKGKKTIIENKLIKPHIDDFESIDLDTSRTSETENSDDSIKKVIRKKK